MAGWAFDDDFAELAGCVPLGVTRPPRVGFFAMVDPPPEDRAASSAAAHRANATDTESGVGAGPASAGDAHQMNML
jgi:hypothetical protein